MAAVSEVTQATDDMPKASDEGKATVRLPMVVTEAFAARLDAFRAQEPGLPNRSEAIRILVTEALAAREKLKPKKD